MQMGERNPPPVVSGLARVHTPFSLSRTCAILKNEGLVMELGESS